MELTATFKCDFCDKTVVVNVGHCDGHAEVPSLPSGWRECMISVGDDAFAFVACGDHSNWTVQNETSDRLKMFAQRFLDRELWRGLGE